MLVRIDEAPAPLEADDVDVEGVGIVRGILEKCVEGEGVDRQAEKQGDQQDSQDGGEGGVPPVRHHAEARRVRRLRGPGFPPVLDEKIEEEDEDRAADDDRREDV